MLVDVDGISNVYIMIYDIYILIFLAGPRLV